LLALRAAYTVQSQLRSDPLPARPAGEGVRQLTTLARICADPCRLVRQVKEFGS